MERLKLSDQAKEIAKKLIGSKDSDKVVTLRLWIHRLVRSFMARVS